MTPVLTGPARAAVDHRGSHLQIIAAAGAGKTEVVSQRVVELIADGVVAREIVAFTFTEKAAAELKDRITERLRDRLGAGAVDRLSGMYVGTIHGYCFQFLQQRVPLFETYDVLDENQHVALLCREATLLKLKETVGKGLFASIEIFTRSVDVVENELIDPATVDEPFGSLLRQYYAMLDRYHLMTFGMQIAHAVRHLESPDVAAAFRGTVRHLIVDEYQDVNPAQERLIQLIAASGAEVCVVGDDDQAIYQWRGSAVDNILTFAERYPNVVPFRLETNRRSLPTIITAANKFAREISSRIDKKMQHARTADEVHDCAQVVAWAAETEAEEADAIARMVVGLRRKGLPFGQIAVLARSRTAYPALLQSLARHSVPVQPGGRGGLFDQPDAALLGQVFCLLGGIDWKLPYKTAVAIEEAALIAEITATFDLEPAARTRLGKWLTAMKGDVAREDRSADLVGELYDLLAILGIARWDPSDPMQLNRLGTVARFTSVLADYESVRRRARVDTAAPGEQVGGQDRGEWYYRNLAVYISNYATGEMEDFDGEEEVALDAITLSTVHGAKGLEWPAVFVPSLTRNRFPSSKNGNRQEWLLPRDRFNAARYEGQDDDERRLFYVAITRPRDWLSVSRHERVTKQSVGESPYFPKLGRHFVDLKDVKLPALRPTGTVDDTLQITYSDLAAFLECGWAYRLRVKLGFMPRLAAQIGFGKAVHHVLRAVAERTKMTGRVPPSSELDRLLDDEFFLPAANKVVHRELKENARGLIRTYATKFESDLLRVWETERPFELHLDGVVVSGRADVILDRADGKEGAYTLVDYKTAAAHSDAHDLQLRIYADAGRREGLDVREAFVHDLAASGRIAVDVSEASLVDAEQTVNAAAVRLRSREYLPNPERQRCGACDVRTICQHSAAR